LDSLFVGGEFLAAGISLLLNRYVRLGAELLGLMFTLWVLVLHGPRVVAKPQVEAEWTSLFVALSMASVGFLFAGSARRAAQQLDELTTGALPHQP
jgi:hypothetical protein